MTSKVVNVFELIDSNNNGWKNKIIDVLRSKSLW